MAEIIKLGRWTEESVERMLVEASSIADTGTRIEFISAQFLNTPYKGSTLAGGINTPEVFVIDLSAVDCFTFIDYIETMRRADSFALFKKNLKDLRYRGGNIAYTERNHFFTDWSVYNQDFIEDVTEEASASQFRKAEKRLNEKKDGTPYLPGISASVRRVSYIPSGDVHGAVAASLKTGDYIGIYSEDTGLDVTHAGVIIRKKDTVFLRHASSRKTNGGVVDEDLLEYLKTRPGIIVLRPKG